MDLDLGTYGNGVTAEQKEKIKQVFRGARNLVEIYDIEKRKSGYGHYEIIIAVRIDGHRGVFNRITDNMELIDNWKDDDDFQIIAPETLVKVMEMFEEEIQEICQNLPSLTLKEIDVYTNWKTGNTVANLTFESGEKLALQLSDSDLITDTEDQDNFYNLIVQAFGAAICQEQAVDLLELAGYDCEIL